MGMCAHAYDIHIGDIYEECFLVKMLWKHEKIWL